MKITNQPPPFDAFDVQQFIRVITFAIRHEVMSYDDAVALNEREFGTAQEAEIAEAVQHE